LHTVCVVVVDDDDVVSVVDVVVNFVDNDVFYIGDGVVVDVFADDVGNGVIVDVFDDDVIKYLEGSRKRGGRRGCSTRNSGRGRTFVLDSILVRGSDPAQNHQHLSGLNFTNNFCYNTFK